MSSFVIVIIFSGIVLLVMLLTYLKVLHYWLGSDYIFRLRIICHVIIIISSGTVSAARSTRHRVGSPRSSPAGTSCTARWGQEGNPHFFVDVLLLVDVQTQTAASIPHHRDGSENAPVAWFALHFLSLVDGETEAGFVPTSQRWIRGCLFCVEVVLWYLEIK